MVFVGLFLLASITWYLLGIAMPERKPHKRVALCVLNSWAVFLGISANNRPEWSPLRVFFIILALYGLNVTTIYTSKLITVFTSPAYEEQIDTIDEIVESGLPIGKFCRPSDQLMDAISIFFFVVFSSIAGGREEYYDWFENDNPEDRILFDLYNYSDTFWPSFENLKDVRDGKRVLLLNRIYVLSKTMPDVFAMPGDVLVNPLEMITERGFPLLKPFNRLISHMIDTGIIDKLYKDFLYNVTVLENIRDRTEIPDTLQIVLTLDHLNGAFSAWLLGLFVSFMVFAAELAIAWCARSRRAMKWCRILKFRYRRVTKNARQI